MVGQVIVTMLVVAVEKVLLVQHQMEEQGKQVQLQVLQ